MDFYSFAERFRLATEGVETDVTMDESDYTAQTTLKTLPLERKRTQRRKLRRRSLVELESLRKRPSDVTGRSRRQRDKERAPRQ